MELQVRKNIQKPEQKENVKEKNIKELDILSRDIFILIKMMQMILLKELQLDL